MFMAHGSEFIELPWGPDCSRQPPVSSDRDREAETDVEWRHGPSALSVSYLSRNRSQLVSQ